MVCGRKGGGKVEFTGRKGVIREGVNGAMDQDVAIDWASLDGRNRNMLKR